MRENPIKRRIADGGTVLNAWCSLPCAYAAEVIANQGYDSVTIDLQHGAMHFETAFAMLQAVATTSATPMVRVPWNDPALLMKLLDAGAFGVICPMVNTAQEARAFVAACRYPPDGIRSYGPGRVVYSTHAASGAEYAANANAQILLLAQIETRAAIDNLDDIVKTPGLDGVYVGPGDLSMALGAPPAMNPKSDVVLKAMAAVLQAARARGMIAAVHTDGPHTARRRFAEGFHLCSLQNDVRLLSDAARAQVLAARETKSS